MNYIRAKVKLIILLSIALIVIQILLESNQRDIDASFDGKNTIEVITPKDPGESSVYYENTDGFALDVYVSGDYAYVADSSEGLAVIDISDPTNPGTPVYKDTDGSARSVYVSGDYAYVADLSAGLAIIDISDPTNPGTPVYKNTSDSAYDVYVSGDYAYVAVWNSGLAVIDISDPTNPGTPVHKNMKGSASSVYVSGDYAYLENSGGLAVIDISDPTNPGTPVYAATDGSAKGVYVSGDYAYIADYDSGLAVIDISDPINPGTPIYEATTDSAYDVYVSGDYAYVADYKSGLAIIDISDPTNPRAPFYEDTDGSAYGVYVSGDYAYMGVGAWGLAVINISDPTNPGTPVYADTLSSARGVYVSGDYAYVGDGGSGLAAIDISDPTNPGTPTYAFTDGSAWDVYVSGDYAYVSDWSEGLAVIDISNPTKLGTPVYENTTGSAYGVYVSGDYAYVGVGYSGLAVIDISDPTNPGMPVYADTDGSAYGVYVSGDYAYVADRGAGLAIIDISDPTNPGTPVYKNTDGSAFDVYVSGDYAYVADYYEGLAVINISDPTNPGTPTYELTDDYALGVYVSGDYAYVADSSEGLAIIDISDPTDPGTPIYVDTTGTARGIYVSGDYAYVGDGISGLAVIQVRRRLDIVDPIITILYPNTNNNLFGKTAPSFSVKIEDIYPGIDTMWYTLDGGFTNTTFTANESISQTLWESRGNGTVTIRFYANDTSGNINWEEIVVRKDILDPLITINSPNPNDLFGSSAPYYDISIFEGNLQSIWYRLLNGTVTTENTTITDLIGVFGENVWDSVGNGIVTIQFFANDTLGNIGFSEVIVRKDISVPIIAINSPILHDIFRFAPDFNISVSGSNLDTTWYTLDNGITNYTFIGLIGKIDQSAWNNQVDGFIIIKFYINNTLNVIGYDEITVIKDTIGPGIHINYPIPNELVGNIAPIFNVEISDINGIDTLWYTLDGGITNTTFTTNESISQTLWESRGNGTVTIRFYANDTSGNINWKEIPVRKDILGPIITINAPIMNQEFKVAPTYEISIIEVNLDKIWYTLDGGLTNITITNLMDTIDQTVWEGISEGSLTIRFYANDTLGNTDFADIIIFKVEGEKPEPDLLRTIATILSLIGGTFTILGIFYKTIYKGKIKPKTWAKELTSSRDEKVRFHAASKLVKSKSKKKSVILALEKAAHDASEKIKIRNLAKEALKERGVLGKD